MVKKLIPLLLICFLLGCSKQPAIETEPVPETSAPAETVCAATEYVPEDVELQAVNKHSFRKTRQTPSIVALDNRMAAFLTEVYPDNQFSHKCTEIQIVDLHTDTVICETVLEGTYAPVFQCAVPGYLALASENGEVLVLDRSLRQVMSFCAQSAAGVLTEELGAYYYVWGSDLIRLDTASGDSSVLETPMDLDFQEILGFDAQRGTMLLSAYAGTYAGELCVTAIRLDSIECELLYGNVTGGAIAGDGVLLKRLQPDALSADVIYGDWTDDTLNMIPAFLVNDLEYAAWHISGSDYICQFTYDKAQKISIEECALIRLGDTVSAASLQEELKGAKLTKIIALSDGNLLAMESNSRGYRTYLICPDQLEFTEMPAEQLQENGLVDTGILEGAAEQLWQIPDELLKARSKADALEEAYDITILLSGECTDALKTSGMTITTTDLAGLPNEPKMIADALDKLDAMLSLYPKNFFTQFRDAAGERGLLVLLVEDFESDINVIGLSYPMGKWYPIAVDITSGEVANTICHEIWHATENRIADLNEVALDLAAWENCNPAGFKYSGNMTPSYVDDTANTYLRGKAGEPVHFVDPYAKVNAHEDRARLMEYVMCTELDARMMLEHPAMAAKLQILCDAIRQAFDTQNWEQVHWERFQESPRK